MTREEQRRLRTELKNEIAEFFNIQQHYFPNLIEDIRQVLDERHESYIKYEVEVILYVMILKNVCSIASMKEMTSKSLMHKGDKVILRSKTQSAFNEETLVKNIYKILRLEERKYLPHYVTINDYLSKLDPNELEKIRKNMLVSILRKRSFQDARLLGKYWCVIVDATQLFSYKKRHCEHCLTKTFNRGEEDEKTVYYHQVLEAKIILGDRLAVSIGTEFIDNESENLSKQDCELKAFKRLSHKMKEMFPRLPMCILGDSLYASNPFMQICKEKNWEYLVRYKDGSIPTLAQEYRAITEIKGFNEKIVWVEEVLKGNAIGAHSHHIKWVNDLDYKENKVSVMELDIDNDNGRIQGFKWLSSMEINRKNAVEFTQTGRQRWMIENQGFNMQKNKRYMITHQNSSNYQALQNHYLITQIADMLIQLYEYGFKGIKEIKRIVENISKGLLDSLSKTSLTDEDIAYRRVRIEKNQE